ncbi:putative TATA element modulatory factor 1, TATA binding protein [Plasmopara halstedii]
MSSAWGGWGTKLNVTSIVSQGLEQVRNLRDDVEKSFDQVVTGVPGVRGPLPLTVSGYTIRDQIASEANEINSGTEQIEARIEDVELREMRSEDRTVCMKSEKLPSGNKTAVIEADVTQFDTQQDPLEYDEKVTGNSRDELDLAANALTKPENNEKRKNETIVETKQMELEELPQEMEVEIERKDVEINVYVKEEDCPDEQKRELEQNELKAEWKEAEPAVNSSPVEDEEKSLETSATEKVIEKELEIIDGDDVSSLRKKLAMRESQLLATSMTIQELHDELDKTCHREVVAVERAQFLTEQLENMRHEVTKLTQLHRDTSTSQNADVLALQQALAEKEEKLSALLDEGQVLSVKQAHLEQRLRTLRKEKNEVEARVLKLQTQLESSIEETKDLSTKLKCCEKEKTRLASENQEFIGITDTMKIKLQRSEQEAKDANKTDELDSLKTSIKSSEALNLEKEELQHTVLFLQESIRDLEQDAARREEMARAEIADFKRKWQEAVARVELLGLSVSEATQPFLRQIHDLQEEQRARQESWKATEAALLGRIEEANEQRRVTEQEKFDMEQQVNEFRVKVEENELELSKRQTELVRAQEALERTKEEEYGLRGQVDALQIDLYQAKHQRDAEAAAKEKLQERLDALAKIPVKLEMSAAVTAESEQTRENEVQLRQDLEWHRQELKRLKNAMAARSSTGSPSQQYFGECGIDGESHECAQMSEASILKAALETTNSDSINSKDGNMSVLGLNQLQQRLRLREGENRMLKQQIEALEARQKQTTDEIVRLSSRNALLESGEAQREQVQLEFEKLQKHQVVLLELFGEKEEQVEELQAEVSELRAFYRKQLDTLATHNDTQQKKREK